MIFLGITGGVGAGKTAILNYLGEQESVRILLADEIAHDVMEPGSACYEELKTLFCEDDVFLPEGGFDRPALAQVLFFDDDKREALNGIVHPAVKAYVKEQLALERARGELHLLVFEAALLLEEHYDELCDELWYIFTTEANRRERLKQNRGYSDAKIDAIFASQLTEETFRQHCKQVIDNNGTPEETLVQVADLLQSLRKAE